MAIISKTTITQDVFAKLRTLILAHKPTYTYGTTQTYSLTASFPRDNPTFPLIVLNDSDVSVSQITLDNGTWDWVVSVQIDFYAKELHGKKAISAGRDGLRNTFVGNVSTFDSSDGLVPSTPFWEDSNVDSFREGNQVLNTGSSIVRFILR